MKERNFENLKAQIEAAGQRAGTPLGPEKWNIESKQGDKWWETTIRVGQIHANIPDRTLPALKDKLNQLEAVSHLQELQSDLNDILPPSLHPPVETEQILPKPDNYPTPKRKAAWEIFSVDFPYRLTVVVRGDMKARALTLLAENFQNQAGVTNQELATLLYGDSSRRSLEKTDEIIAKIKKDLPPHWSIEHKNRTYKLMQPPDVDEEIIVEPILEETTLIDTSAAQEINKFQKERQFLPQREGLNRVHAFLTGKADFKGLQPFILGVSNKDHH